MKKPLVLFFLLFVALQLNGQEINLSNYLSSITKQRQEKDSVYKHSNQSPLTKKQIAHFEGLHYYPVNIHYRITAHFERTPFAIPFKMATNTSRQPEYKKYGHLHFSMGDKKLSLAVYQNLNLIQDPAKSNYLFLPFSDETSTIETYGSGRYLDLVIQDGTQWVLDFNLAYNPYCAYNHKYSCPIPPPENYLPLKIEAGEKKYHNK